MTVFETYFASKEFVWKIGLDRIKGALSALSFSLPPSVIVAGTNGKGSTSALIASIVKEHGKKVGLFTSPHILKFNERFRIDFKQVDTETLNRAFREILPVVEKFSLTYFEAAFLLAVFLFRDCDFVVYEVGLGGRLDATNAVSHSLAVITHIDFDHKDYLGDTIEKIAIEKLHVVKDGIPVVISDNPPVVFDLAKEFTDRITAFGRDFSVSDIRVSFSGTEAFYRDGDMAFRFLVPLYGFHQAVNSATAISAAKIILREVFGEEFLISKTVSGLSSVKLPGRFQIVRREPLLIVDVAHNPDAVRRFVETLKLLELKVDILYSGLRDKDVKEVISILEYYTKSCGRQLFITEILNNDRALSAEDLGRFSGSASVVKDISTILDRPIAVVGSFYLIGKLFNYLSNDSLFFF
ncbi:bifunctional folylpolyglutamate synthase/dihydrofolate synthase [Desulfurobacterium sp.]